LESNPDVMNSLLHSLGVPKKWGVVDVYGLDSELLAIVPQPVLSVILLFPCTGKKDDSVETQTPTSTTDKKHDEVIDQPAASKNVWFMKQLVANACGTVALIHSVFNNLDSIELDTGCLKKFYEDCKGLCPEDAGRKLLECEDIATVHEDISKEGQTEAPNPTDRVDYHFIAFIEKGGHLYELDGRHAAAVYHQKTSKVNLLQDAAKVIRAYMDKDPDNIQFNIVALTSLEESTLLK